MDDEERKLVQKERDEELDYEVVRIKKHIDYYEKRFVVSKMELELDV